MHLTYVDATAEKAGNKEAGIQATVGNVAELNVLSATASKTADGTVHANGAEC